MSQNEFKMTNVNVLMTSGDEDQWTDVTATLPGDGSVLVFDDKSNLAAVYAPGMWMRVEHKP